MDEIDGIFARQEHLSRREVVDLHGVRKILDLVQSLSSSHLKQSIESLICATKNTNFELSGHYLDVRPN